MPEHFREFPTPRHTYELAMQRMRERMELGEKISALDLIATHESYFARDLDREEALREMDKLAERLKRVRERHGNKRMVQELTKRLYARPYNLRQNTMLGLFTGSERGNCQATAKAASTILEQVGLDPKTQIAHQMFSDHVRALAKVGESWQVLEGHARPLRTKEIAGTKLVSLEDEKRGLLNLPSSSPIEMGETAFHWKDGETLNRGLTNWFRQSLTKVDAWVGGFLPHKTPSIHVNRGERPAVWSGMTNIESLLVSLFPFTPRQTKLVASSLAALSFLYATSRYRDPNVETMEDLSEVIHEDVERVRDTAKTVVETIADFAKRELEDLKASAMLEPLPAGSRRKREDEEEREPMQIVEGFSRQQMDELDRRFAAYYGAAHFLLEGGRGVQMLGTEKGFGFEISVQPEAKTIGKDLYRYFMSRGLQRDIVEGLPDHFFVDFHGEHLNVGHEREKLRDAIEHIGEFRREPSEPFPGYLEFRINGEKIGSLGNENPESAPEQKQETDTETNEAMLADFMFRQTTQALEDFKNVVRSKDTITEASKSDLTWRAEGLKTMLLQPETMSGEARLRKLDEIQENYKQLWIRFNWYERNDSLSDEFKKYSEPHPLFSKIHEARSDLAELRIVVGVLEQGGLLSNTTTESHLAILRNYEPLNYEPLYDQPLSPHSLDKYTDTTRDVIKHEKEWLRGILADSNHVWSLPDQALFRSVLGPRETGKIPSSELQRIFDELLPPPPSRPKERWESAEPQKSP